MDAISAPDLLKRMEARLAGGLSIAGNA
jgi:hypothetical protein